MQQRLLLADSETTHLVKSLTVSDEDGVNDQEPNGNGKDAKANNGALKRKLKNSKSKSSDGESEESNEDDDDDNDDDDDDDDEEIYSDTDEEMQANALKSEKSRRKLVKFEYKSLESEQFEDYLAKLHRTTRKYR